MEQMNAQQAIQRIEQPQTMALDAVGRKAAIDDLLNKVALVQEVMAKVMHEGEHYGKIPGCGDKPALLKAGAEKLGMTFRLKASFDVNERDLGNGHREYSIRCLLSDGNMGVGSCSTMESKYRYRSGERKCPACGKATIIKGKEEYGGGWLCYAKKGGCGEKFAVDDKSITDQQVGKVEHDNPADFYNTCLKMGKKRAHVDAIITATACSDIFTQDVEEIVSNAEVAGQPKAGAPPAEKSATAQPKAESPPTGPETLLPRVEVKMVTEKKGTNKQTGKPWTCWTVLLNDGVGELEASTFSKTLGQAAAALDESEEMAQATIRPGRKPGTHELVSLVPIPSDKATDDLPYGDEPQGEPQKELIP